MNLGNFLSLYVIGLAVQSKALSLIQPLPGQVNPVGAPLLIQWQPSPFVAYVALDLLYEGTLQRSIIPKTLNDGTYNYSIPADTKVSTKYAIRIRDLSNTSQVSSGRFQIASPFHVTSPSVSSSYQAGLSLSIQWTSTVHSDTISLVLVHLETNFQLLVVSDVPAFKNIYYWTIPPDLLPLSNYHIDIISNQRPLLRNQSPVFQITQPWTVLWPKLNQRLHHTQNQTILWTNANYSTSVRIQLLLYGTQVKELAQTAPNTGSFAWSVSSSLKFSDSYQIAISPTSRPHQRAFSSRFQIDSVVFE